MPTPTLRLTFFTLCLLLLELVINSSSHFYFDLIGIFLIILLLFGNYSLRFLVILSLLADLIGHWYLGTHLVGIILLSFLTDKVVNFFLIYNLWHKLILTQVFYFMLVMLSLIIGILTHNLGFHLVNYGWEIIFVVPVILTIFNFLFISSTT